MVLQLEMATGIQHADTLSALQARINGDLILPHDPRYDTARKVQNITVDRRPLAIVRAAGAQDVAAAVQFARTFDLPLAVRSGGHSVATHSMISDGIVVDLSGMKQIAIDPETCIARVGAGATSGDLAGPASTHNLALSTGDTSSVGFGGLVTGGGIGFMARKYGLSIDSLIAAEVVTAAGEIVTASADEHPDLFWAIRGGGGNFGIVTEFTFRLAPVGLILGGVLMLPATRAVLRGYLDYAASAPDDLTTIANLMHAPPAPFVPAERIGETVLMVLVCWTGDIAEGERALAPLRALATPVAEAIGPMPYPALYAITAPQAAPHAAAVRMMFADTLSDATLDATLASMERATSPLAVVQFRGLGGAVARVSEDATAFAHRTRRYFVAVINAWQDAAEDGDLHRTWTESVWQAIRDERAGVYANFLGNEGRDRVREAYPPATYARLAAIKRQYDPENLFRFNQNIHPAH
jgi:FAD/FMN-containing dehydrogenase